MNEQNGTAGFLLGQLTLQLPSFDFIGSATNIKNIILLISVWFQVQYVNGYLFHHYPVHLPFIILVSYLMLNTAVKGFSYREAVMYENA